MSRYGGSQGRLRVDCVSVGQTSPDEVVLPDIADDELPDSARRSPMLFGRFFAHCGFDCGFAVLETGPKITRRTLGRC